ASRFGRAHHRSGRHRLGGGKRMAGGRSPWMTVGLVLGVLFLIVLFVAGYVRTTFNELVSQQEQVRTAWSQVENQLQRRNDLISVERMRYNELVRAYNIKIRQFPSNLVASAFNFELMQLFEAVPGAKTPPAVKF